MKRALIAAVCLAGAFSLSAQACPAGTRLVGGTGPHHKGGQCVSKTAAASHTGAYKKAHNKPMSAEKVAKDKQKPSRVDQSPSRD